MLLGLKVDSAIKPKLGSIWNKISAFPTIVNPSNKRNSSAQKNPAAGQAAMRILWVSLTNHIANTNSWYFYCVCPANILFQN